MLRPAALLAVLALAPAAAGAALPPDAIEAARRDAPNVVVFDVLRVTTPLFRSYGTCRVQGRVIRSERGTLYAPGARVALAVPCAKAGAPVPPGGDRWTDMPALKRSAHGRAHLDAAGALILGQYDLYDLH